MALWDKKKEMEKKIINLICFYCCDKTPSQPIMKVNQGRNFQAGPGSRDRNRGHGGMLLADLYLMGDSAFFLTVQDFLPRDSAATIGWALTYQSLKEKVPAYLPLFSQSDRNISSAEVLFPQITLVFVNAKEI